MNLLERNISIPRASSISVNGDEVTLVLSGTAIEGAKLTFLARGIKPLAVATDEQLAGVDILHDGALLYWRSLDAEFRVSKIIELVTGIQSLQSAQSKGGLAATAAKSAAARANGAKGGRPRKKPVEAT